MEEEHLVNLQNLFGQLRKYRLRLNPRKCMFGVMSEKLLGFVVSQRGIELDHQELAALYYIFKWPATGVAGEAAQ